jgi:hypothetical protein
MDEGKPLHPDAVHVIEIGEPGFMLDGNPYQCMKKLRN